MKNSAQVHFEQLVDWMEGRLSTEETEAIAARLASADATTRATVAWLWTFHQASKGITLASLPADLRQQLAELFQDYARDRHTPNLFQRLTATLTSDANDQPAAKGICSTTASSGDQQLLYATTVAKIALNIHLRTHDKRLDVSGRIFPMDDRASDTFVVQLLQETAEVAITMTDDLGQFAFKALNSDLYEMILSNDRVEIVIESLELGEQCCQA